MTGQIIVIGAGIIGMCAANYLQRYGLKVTVLDAVGPGKSCSFGNAGALSSGLAIDLRRRRVVTFEVLAPEEIRQLEPALAPIFKRAVWFPDHGHCAIPFALVEALAGACLRSGGQILARRVLDLECKAEGAHTVVTDVGPMPVETLLVAAGAWSHRLASKLGHTVPLERSGATTRCSPIQIRRRV